MIKDELIPPVTPLQPTLSWGWWEIVKALLFIVFGVILLGVAIAVIALATHSDIRRANKLSSGPLFAAAVGIYAFVVLAVYLFAVRRAGGSWAQVGVRSFAWWWAPLAPVLTFAQFVGMYIININLVIRLTGKPFENPQIQNITGGRRLTFTDLILLLVLVAVIAPIAEELLFRGMLYPVLRHSWGMTAAIVVNALLFALVHVIPILIPGLFFVGLVLAWVRERSGSVIPGMLIHALQNGILMLGIYSLSLT